jgi:hypothetical protein
MEILCIANSTVNNKRPMFASIWLERFKRVRKSASFGQAGREVTPGVRLAKRYAFWRAVLQVIGIKDQKNSLV